MAATTPRSRDDIARDWIRRLVAYTSSITWFGATGVAAGFAKAVGDLAEIAYDLFVSLKRRYTLTNSSDANLTEVASEFGTARLTSTRAHVYAIFAPYSATVEAITPGATDLIEVTDSSKFLMGDSMRIRNSTGATSEVFVVIAVTTGTGPHGHDELECLPLTGTYTPATDDVSVLLRTLITVGTTITGTSGMAFQTLSTVTTGDAAPLFDSEPLFVGLADKCDCECTVGGTSGNIQPNGLSTVAGSPRISRVYNPEAGFGGDDETDPALKSRAANRATLANQETTAWLFALAKEGNPYVLRTIKDTTAALSTIRFRVLKRSCGLFTAAELTELTTYMEDRFRSQLLADPTNVSLTAISVEAQVRLTSSADLRTCWRAAASSIAAYLDPRVWIFGTTVDNAEILQIIMDTSGIATVDTTTFLPAAQVPVGVLSLPALIYFAIEDIDTGETYGGDLAVSF